MAAGMEPLGLVTERADFAGAGLPALEEFVFGGHEIQGGSLRDRARVILADCGLPLLADHVGEALDAVEARIRPGVVRGGGKQIAALGDDVVEARTDAEAVEKIRRDLDEFQAAVGADRLVVVNLASTEPQPPWQPCFEDADALLAALAGPDPVLPPSSLYACAALLGGDAFVNFTPSLGSRLPALEALALRTGAVHAGSDGKTGETLVKSVLSELFARRNLPVLSWFGQNILGNGDGRVLDDPANKATKIRSKDHLLPKLLGYAPESRVGIDYVGSLGEWKIAWDHIHFQGFLGGRMTMQFVWNGCDSLLAAPLVLDLVRLTAFAQGRGESGVLGALGAFFKDPMGTDEQRLVAQDEALLRWLASPA
ncbi:MAG: inositol-3-phosphate synthase [Myxococcales bacterium]|nr:inositol-3-phosphate synthase [Myxococcales bacterium]